MIEDGLILKGMRIVIPDKKREEILKQIHEGHLVLNKCQMRAKETVYWPGLNEQLEQVRKLKSMSAQHIAEHFKSIFSEYGWPDTLVSNNGMCYAAETFADLMKEYAVNHINSSLHYPQSNGLVEKFVQIVKKISLTKREMKELIFISP